MLQRRLAYTTSRLLLNGQGAALCQGFARSSQQEASLLPPSAAAVVAGPAQLPSPCGLRWHSDLAERKEGREQPFVYEGPFATAVTRVKKLSLFSCLCAVSAGPIILGLDATTTYTAKLSIVGTLSAFGAFTTGLLTWFTQPYITRLRYEPATETVEATTLSLLARPRTDTFHLAEVEEVASVHPLSSFQAHGRRYYLDADHFPNKELLLRLQPAAMAAHAMGSAHAAQQQAQQQGQQQGQQPQ